MKLRILQEGWETFTGQLGVNTFQDGLSVEDMLPRDAVRIAAQMFALWEDGSTPTLGSEFGQLLSMSAPIVGEGHDENHVVVPQNDTALISEGAAPAEKVAKHSFETLSKVVDEKGIAGLREIGNEFNVKAKAVGELMNLILEAQAKQ
jgi:hypothetical protein